MITDHRFVGLRQWGIDPPEDARCQHIRYGLSGICDYPKNQHAVLCPSVLNLKGESFRCDMVAPHDGWGHANKVAQAVWGEGGPND